jgi:mono/diheme cytochrome c family protein
MIRSSTSQTAPGGKRFGGEDVMRHLGAVLVVLLQAASAAGVAADLPAQAAGTAPTPPVSAPPSDAAVAGVAGAYSYKTHCASCHGIDGKGEGPLSDSLRFRPPDLTLIARRNGGTFPAERVYRIVDGRKPLKGHGGPDMPIWGDAFKNSETGFDDAQVKARVRSVVDHLKTIQAQ